MISSLLLLLVEGMAIGLIVGLTGAGGGILAVPALMTTQGWSVAQSAPVGLLAITMSAFVGTVQGLFKKIVRYRAAIWIALIGAPAAHIGVKLSALLPAVWLSFLFGLVMLWVAGKLFLNNTNDFMDPPCHVSPQTGQLIWNAKTAMVLGTIGMTSGLLTGLLGVGGGFIIVPALKRFTDIEMHSIVATSLMIICLLGGIGIAAHLVEHYQFPLMVTAVFLLACISGMLLGRQLIAHVSTIAVQKLFSVLVLMVGVYMVFSALHTLFN